MCIRDRDSFFEVMSDPFLKGNKQGNRPHYYCFEDDESGIYWIIPLSSRVSTVSYTHLDVYKRQE